MSMYFLFIVPPLLLMLYAQWRVTTTYNKYAKVSNMSGLSGLQAAEKLLSYQGLTDVKIEVTKGKLTDHYDPRSRVLALSPEVASRASVAALGIVAHEVGHAVQHARLYTPLKVRNAIFPAANIGSQFGFIMVFAGFILYGLGTQFGLNIAWIGVGLFSLAVLFSLITLPVEFNASSRARTMLKSAGMVSTQEYEGASAVLSAAALTYIAALVQMLMQLIYFVLMLLGANRR